jgi:hypothetical protein
MANVKTYFQFLMLFLRAARLAGRPLLKPKACGIEACSGRGLSQAAAQRIEPRLEIGDRESLRAFVLTYCAREVRAAPASNAARTNIHRACELTLLWCRRNTGVV